MRTWERYEGWKTRASREQPRVTVQASGVFGLNLAAWEALGRPARVELLFDRMSGAFGLRPIDGEAGLRVSLRKRGGVVVSARGFVRSFGITPGQYRATMESGVMVVDVGLQDART